MLCCIVDHLSDIECLSSDNTDGNDDDESVADNDRPAADVDDVLSIDVQDSPVVSASQLPVTEIFPPVCASQVRW